MLEELRDRCFCSVNTWKPWPLPVVRKCQVRGSAARASRGAARVPAKPSADAERDHAGQRPHETRRAERCIEVLPKSETRPASSNFKVSHVLAVG